MSVPQEALLTIAPWPPGLHRIHTDRQSRVDKAVKVHTGVHAASTQPGQPMALLGPVEGQGLGHSQQEQVQRPQGRVPSVGGRPYWPALASDGSSGVLAGELSMELAQLLQQGPQLLHGGQNSHPKVVGAFPLSEATPRHHADASLL